MQIPVHPFLLLLSFNLFSSATGLSPYIAIAARWWGTFLRYSTPFAAGLEGLASLIVIQSAGLRSKELATQSEGNQLLLLIGSASAYVGAAAWLLSTFAGAASTPIAAVLFGCAVTSLIFLTGIGFSLRRTNVVESSGVALFLAYNVWQCTNDNFGVDILSPKVSVSS
jgi:ICE2